MLGSNRQHADHRHKITKLTGAGYRFTNGCKTPIAYINNALKESSICYKL